MKFLVDEEKPRQAVEAASQSLERKEQDPVIEENLLEDLSQLNEICSNFNPKYSK
jgi:hypothetical protein